MTPASSTDAATEDTALPADGVPAAAGGTTGLGAGSTAPSESSGGCQLGAAATAYGAWMLLLSLWAVRRRRSV